MKKITNKNIVAELLAIASKDLECDDILEQQEKKTVFNFLFRLKEKEAKILIKKRKKWLEEDYHYCSGEIGFFYLTNIIQRKED